MIVSIIWVFNKKWLSRLIKIPDIFYYIGPVLKVIQKRDFTTRSEQVVYVNEYIKREISQSSID